MSQPGPTLCWSETSPDLLSLRVVTMFVLSARGFVQVQLASSRFPIWCPIGARPELRVFPCWSGAGLCVVCNAHKKKGRKQRLA